MAYGSRDTGGNTQMLHDFVNKPGKIGRGHLLAGLSRRSCYLVCRFVLDCFLALSAISLIMIPAFSAAEDALRVDAGALAGLQFLKPGDEGAKGYLGLKGSGKFALPQIKADTVIIEIFSMYCPICQAEAPVVNKLHELIETTPSLKGKVKLIGIGAGNSQFEIEVFRKKYNVLFPLLADEQFAIQQALSRPIRTPTFIAVKGNGGKTLEVYRAHIGRIDPKQFLKEATAESGPK